MNIWFESVTDLQFDGLPTWISFIPQRGRSICWWVSSFSSPVTWRLTKLWNDLKKKEEYYFNIQFLGIKGNALFAIRPRNIFNSIENSCDKIDKE